MWCLFDREEILSGLMPLVHMKCSDSIWCDNLLKRVFNGHIIWSHNPIVKIWFDIRGRLYITSSLLGVSVVQKLKILYELGVGGGLYNIVSFWAYHLISIGETRPPYSWLRNIWTAPYDNLIRRRFRGQLGLNMSLASPMLSPPSIPPSTSTFICSRLKHFWVIIYISHGLKHSTPPSTDKNGQHS